MPLCARCTGIYVGVLLAFCFLLLKKRMDAGRPFSKGQAMLTALMILPIGIDGPGSYLGFWESNQLMRVLSGSLVGAVVPGFLLLAVNFDPAQGSKQPIYAHTTELLLLLLLWGGFVWLLLKNLCGRKRLPFWQISLAAAFLGLYAIGGLMQ